jgi:hypothetical protein
MIARDLVDFHMKWMLFRPSLTSEDSAYTRDVSDKIWEFLSKDKILQKLVENPLRPSSEISDSTNPRFGPIL